jgi:hypothetical protein
LTIASLTIKVVYDHALGLPALEFEECMATAIRLLVLDGRSAKLAGGLPSGPILSGLSRIVIDYRFFDSSLRKELGSSPFLG